MWCRPSRISPSRMDMVERSPSIAVAHDLEKCETVFRKDHAQNNKQSFCANPASAQARSGDGRRCAQAHEHDFGRHAETERGDAAAEAARDDDVAIEPCMA